MQTSAMEDGTTQVLMKFQEQLALKDQQLTEMQANSKRKQAEFNTKLAAQEKKAASELAKVEAKVKK